jgi:tryptophan 2,3-dioxygenase
VVGRQDGGAGGAAAGRLTYGSYLRVPQLLSLQHPRSSPPHHDEMLFIISHQVYELWFRQILHEVALVNEHLDADRPLRAAQLLERIHRIQHLLIEQIPLLETMFAADFADFRASLGTSSGFQSVQFRRLEFLLGNKNPKMLALVGVEEDEATRRGLEEALGAPTPYDHFLRHLSREDHRVFQIPETVLRRDTSRPHEVDGACVEALALLYRLREGGAAPGAPTAGERYYAQFLVAERLLELDEKFALWRYHHVKMVERMIGGKAGTGGSAGARYLRTTLDRPFWPDLWAVRDLLGGGRAQPPGPDSAPAQ